MASRLCSHPLKPLIKTVTFLTKVGTTIAIAALDEEGYYAHIGGSHLKLVSPQGERIGRIARTQGHLYKVVHALDAANAVEPVSVMELHHHLALGQ